ncbi:DUF3313 family protein [Cellvibrio sp. KY-GH-1]|uniref:M56 family metallopeptidase n=1 Tax=Cellvibrio sp. KY-GH-1 TaxID=2303332 RepID=UPI001246D25F|nr:M56 family metallopeptidase [Cellvibrio sp. KY-GH-1]QEY16514.1 DUF3313 family protein [Cellvibrio sp. KY-GH-1]
MNNLFNQMFDDLGFALAWTLLHSIWQFAIFAFCYVCFSRFIKTSALRYQFALGLFSLCALVSALTFQHYYSSIVDAQQTLATSLPSAAQPQAQATFSNAIRFFNGNIHWIMYIWAFGFLLHLSRTTLDFINCRKLVQFGSHDLDQQWIGKFAALEQVIGTTTKVIYKTSAMVSSPCVIGVFKPVILIPPAVLLSLTPTQIEAVMLHELAHVKRNDYLVNLLQCAVKSIFFFNPFLVYLSKKIDQERENSCDDLAVSHCASTLTYASSISALTELGLSNRLALAANADKYSVLNRVKRLFGDQPNEKTTFQFFSSALIAMLGMVMAMNIQAVPYSTAKTSNQEKNPTEVSAPVAAPIQSAAPANLAFQESKTEQLAALEQAPTAVATDAPVTTAEVAAVAKPAIEADVKPTQKPAPVAQMNNKAESPSLATQAAIDYVNQEEAKADLNEYKLNTAELKQLLKPEKSERIAAVDEIQPTKKMEPLASNKIALDYPLRAAEAAPEGASSYSYWNKSRFTKFFVNEKVDFTKYNRVILFPTTFDRLKISEKTKESVAKAWMKSTFEEMNEYCNFFDRAATNKFKQSGSFRLAKKGGENVLAIEIRMMEFHPLTASKKDPNVGTLELQAILADSKTGELVAIIEGRMLINAHNVSRHIRRSDSTISEITLLPGQRSPFSTLETGSLGEATIGWNVASFFFIENLHYDMKRFKRSQR